MKRLSGWEKKFLEWLREARTQKFEWGKFDCCLAVCDCVLGMTGIDLAEGFRGKYSTRKDAYRAIRSFATSLKELCEKRGAEFALIEIAPQLASRGDIVLVKSVTGHFALAIVGLDPVHAYAATFEGLQRMGRNTWFKAWRV